MANNLAYLSLGSNLGDREKNLKNAIIEVGKISEIIKKSSIYEAEPVDYKNQPKFLNTALIVKTKFSALELIVQLQEIEHKTGRIKEIEKGPRLIDIDIIFYDNEIINNPNLQIPHPSFAKRNFVLTPMNEIAPNHKDPKSKKTIKKLFKELKNPEQVTLWI